MFDLVVLVAPDTVKARLLLKVIWRLSGQRWDNETPEDSAHQFFEWSRELPSLSSEIIPRSYFKHEVHCLELHVFGDGSQTVLSAVVFLRRKVVFNQNVILELAFVIFKVRVAPMKALTNPKLGLKAAVLALRNRAEVHRAMPMQFDGAFMWTENTGVIQWLLSIDKQPVLVANRVAELFDLAITDVWNYVQSADNPADAGTCGVAASAPLECSWLKCPDFLRTSDSLFKPPDEIVKRSEKPS